MIDEVIHSGILGMRWGFRRFQNPDGSLTPAGRERYGVGVSKNLHGVNDGSSLSNEELRNMEKRYRSQANYYKARNDYLYEQNRYMQLTKPVKKTNEFLKNTLGKPFENVLGKSNEALLGYVGGALLGSIFGEKADVFLNDYYRSLFGKTNNDKKDRDGKQDDKNGNDDHNKKPKDYNQQLPKNGKWPKNNQPNMYWDSKNNEFIFEMPDSFENYSYVSENNYSIGFANPKKKKK